jgi:hypothetical protein
MIEGPRLETMSLISSRCFYTTFGSHATIFSNKFLRLKPFYLTIVYSPSVEVRQLSWNQLPSIRLLYIYILLRDSLIHIAILVACLKLYYLNLSVFQLHHTPSNIKPHINLKRMKFIFYNRI